MELSKTLSIAEKNISPSKNFPITKIISEEACNCIKRTPIPNFNTRITLQGTMAKVWTYDALRVPHQFVASLLFDSFLNKFKDR